MIISNISGETVPPSNSWQSFGNNLVIGAVKRGELISIINSNSLANCQEMCRAHGMPDCFNVEHCTFAEGERCLLYPKKLTGQEKTFPKYDCTGYYKRNTASARWAPFADDHVVGPDSQGTMLHIQSDTTAVACKNSCTRTAGCLNAEFCTNGGGTPTCIMYDEQLSGKEATLSDEACTQYYWNAD